jgi:signal transduction histidine kinase
MLVVTKTAKSSTATRILAYTVADLTTLSVVAFCLLYIPQCNPFLIFIPTVAFFAWSEGFMLGFYTTIFFIFSTALMIFYPVSHPLLTANVNLMINIVIFFFVGAFISYVIDVSKQQDKISVYQRRLRQSNAVIDTLEKNYALQQTEIKARDQFLAIASHELKTPVTSMLLQVQTAIHNIQNVSLANFSVSTLLKMLEDTEAQSKRLSKMVNDLLDISLITTGKINLEMEETDISHIVQQVADRYITRLNGAKQIHLEIKKPVIGYCDKLRIEQAVVNLISNAIKYGNNKQIDVTVTDTHDSAKIVVMDHGIGIPHDQQKRIFNRFERAVSPRDYKGLGVGLYITNQIIQAHHGKIHLDSEAGKGSIFTLEFPLKKAAN